MNQQQPTTAQHRAALLARHHPLAAAVLLACLTVGTAVASDQPMNATSETALNLPAETGAAAAPLVIVGTKQAQGRQQVTQSVAVLTADDTIGLQSALALAARVPNTAQQSVGFLPTVRGLDGNGVATGGGGAVTGANPRMSNYVDGVARTYGATPDGAGSFWDLAQVEVYRGAQSTLLG